MSAPLQGEWMAEQIECLGLPHTILIFLTLVNHLPCLIDLDSLMCKLALLVKSNWWWVYHNEKGLSLALALLKYFNTLRQILSIYLLGWSPSESLRLSFQFPTIFSPFVRAVVL